MNNLSNLSVFQKAILVAIDKTAKQGQQSNNKAGSCAYRGTNSRGSTLCCVIGHMIEDKQYYKELESSNAEGILVTTAVEKSLSADYELSYGDVQLLFYIQVAHDDLYYTANWALEFYTKVNNSINGTWKAAYHCTALDASIRTITDHCLAKIETLTNKKIK